MELGEKMSYLQGLFDGLDIDKTTKEGKIFAQMMTVMNEMADTIDELQVQVDELTELCDVLDADLGEVEEFICGEDDDEDFGHHHGHCCCHDDDDEGYDELDDYDFDEDDEYEFDEDEDELYEVQCPVCNETVVLDESMLEEGSVNCPCCGETLEFDYFGEDEEDDPSENDVPGL